MENNKLNHRNYRNDMLLLTRRNIATLKVSNRKIICMVFGNEMHRLYSFRMAGGSSHLPKLGKKRTGSLNADRKTIGGDVYSSAGKGACLTA